MTRLSAFNFALSIAIVAIMVGQGLKNVPGNAPDDTQDLAAYSVRIETTGPDGNGTGSGTVVGDVDGHPLVLTCAHVVADADKVTIDGEGAHVLRKDSVSDLALLVYDSRHAGTPATVLSTEARPGEVEIVVGFPLGRDISFTRGAFGHDAFDDEWGHWVNQGSAPVWPGNSGGGAYVWRHGWKLAGVPEAIAVEHSLFPYLVPTVSYTIPPQVIRDFLAQPTWFADTPKPTGGNPT